MITLCSASDARGCVGRDLSDIRREGRLNKDEFAVAMRLINDQLDGKALPADGQLPLSMVPPSLRQANSSVNGMQQAPAPASMYIV